MDRHNSYILYHYDYHFASALIMKITIFKLYSRNKASEVILKGRRTQQSDHNIYYVLPVDYKWFKNLI